MKILFNVASGGLLIMLVYLVSTMNGRVDQPKEFCLKKISKNGDAQMVCGAEAKQIANYAHLEKQEKNKRRQDALSQFPQMDISEACKGKWTRDDQTDYNMVDYCERTQKESMKKARAKEVDVKIRRFCAAKSSDDWQGYNACLDKQAIGKRT